MSAAFGLTVDVESGRWRPAAPEEPVIRFIVEAAKSGRSKCSRCTELIAKDDMRVGSPVKWRDYVTRWAHAGCFFLDEGEQAWGPVDLALEVHGLDKISDADALAELRAALQRTEPPAHIKALDPEEVDFSIAKNALERVKAPAAMTIPLLPFQEQGFGWMLAREAQGQGGILADQMGMGKTIQTIALLCATRTPGQPTLIVAPSSAMLQWQDEIKRCTAEGTLSVLVFHSASRLKLTPADLMAHDVVLTSYPTIEYDYRACVNAQKVPCKYCTRKFLPRKLASHNKYFCGPSAIRTQRQAMQERGQTKQSAAKPKQKAKTMKQAMATLGIISGGSSSSARESGKRRRRGRGRGRGQRRRRRARGL